MKPTQGTEGEGGAKKMKQGKKVETSDSDNRLLWMLAALAISIKWLLINSYYRSTDFEVHRNWMAITHNLPIADWYYSAKNQDCTLDYPPLFAYLERVLASAASLYDPDILRLQAKAHFSRHVLLFQRVSVIVLDILYILASMCLTGVLLNTVDWAKGRRRLSGRMKNCLFALLVFQPGLLLLDHVHFQYNSFLYGVLLLSISFIVEGHWLVGAFFFAVLLNLKHIYLYYVPGVIAFYLCHYLLPANERGDIRKLMWRGLKLAAIISLPLIVAFGPFYFTGGVAAVQQIMTRLFPFKRGLTHAYWAPNAWALYNFADFIAYRALAPIARQICGTEKLIEASWLCSLQSPAYTRGIVGEDRHSVLPDISPRTTLLLVLSTTLISIPLALHKMRAKRNGAQQLLICLILSAYAFFMFSWHVHEKAALLMLLPLTLLSYMDPRFIPVHTELLISCLFSLFPLFFTPLEQLVKYTAVGTYLALFFILVRLSHGLCSHNLHLRISYLLLGLLVGLELYKMLLHARLFPRGGAKFLPLMATSVLCAAGVAYSFVHLLFLVAGQSWLEAWAKRQCRRREAAITARGEGLGGKMKQTNGSQHKSAQSISGVDISIVPLCPHLGVVSHTLTRYPEKEIVETKDEVVLLQYDYTPGYLAIREAEAMASVTKRVGQQADLLLVDGNGVFHPRGCGLACHVGYLANIPSVGIAKKFDHAALGHFIGVHRGASTNKLSQEESIIIKRCESLKEGEILELRSRMLSAQGIPQLLLITRRGGHLLYISPGFSAADYKSGLLLALDWLALVEASDRRSRAIVDELFNR